MLTEKLTTCVLFYIANFYLLDYPKRVGIFVK
jgi:hypothetical protein